MPLNTLEDLRAGKLAGSRRLKLAGGLTEFPREIFELAETLEILDLSGNALAALPDDLPRLHRLRILFCSDNRIAELPAVIGQCAQLDMVGFKENRIRRVPAAALPPKLRWLILTDNRIAELPPEIGRCTRLQKLMLAGNQLQSLPAEMANCTRLELERIGPVAETSTTTEANAGPRVNRKKVEKLKSLQADCAQENVSARSLFTEIVSVLRTLMRLQP
jgi:Leucine-rich repeat (LRR) protein